MVTEVTNEQYLEFVKATGYRRPFEWGAAAVDKARETSVAAGEKNFDAEGWWEANWETQEYEVKPAEMMLPVCYISHADSEAYCAWAGLRLPSEQELQNATRGTGDGYYPWGKEPADPSRAVTSAVGGIKAPISVGAMPTGKSAQGIYDLIGNAWEWSSSPFVAYDGWKSSTYTTGKGKTQKKVKSEPNWDGDRRVGCGGGYDTPMVAARCTIRRGTDRTQRTSGLGFRAAASENPVADRAASTYRSAVRMSPARADGAVFAPERAYGWVRWDSRSTSVDAAAIKDIDKSMRRLSPKPAGYSIPEGYAVITGFHYLTFTPAESLEVANEKELERLSLGDPVQFGYLSTSVPLIEPALEPGTYLVAYRAKGDLPEPPKPEGKEAAEEYVPPAWASMIDLKAHNLMFFNVETGELAYYAEVDGGPAHEKVKEEMNGALTVITKRENTKDEKGKMVQVEVPWLQFHSVVGSKQRNYGWLFDFTAKPAKEILDLPWQR
ncbi:MAG: SUMF1/EgtB/PvdO family nonheme iron enzyme [Planctomycetota bacterium]